MLAISSIMNKNMLFLRISSMMPGCRLVILFQWYHRQIMPGRWITPAAFLLNKTRIHYFLYRIASGCRVYFSCMKKKLKDAGDPCIWVLPFRCPLCRAKLLACYKPFADPKRVSKAWYIYCDRGECGYHNDESFDTLDELKKRFNIKDWAEQGRLLRISSVFAKDLF